mmetsp:Transcript_11663/g.22074  ORF Transcript_11663/g.22074 Transcript_11663/m.22074 type:complete len:250 (-) Transcript_11663:728-1477(-)
MVLRCAVGSLHVGLFALGHLPIEQRDVFAVFIQALNSRLNGTVVRRFAIRRGVQLPIRRGTAVIPRRRSRRPLQVGSTLRSLPSHALLERRARLLGAHQPLGRLTAAAAVFALGPDLRFPRRYAPRIRSEARAVRRRAGGARHAISPRSRTRVGTPRGTRAIVGPRLGLYPRLQDVPESIRLRCPRGHGVPVVLETGVTALGGGGAGGRRCLRCGASPIATAAVVAAATCPRRGTGVVRRRGRRELAGQ